MRRALSNGEEARLERDEHGLALVIDGITQSHIGEPGAAPRHASTRWVLAAALAVLEASDGAVLQASGSATALHLGGGAVTIPRLLQQARPGLQQRVIELEPALVELVLEVAPLPAGIELEVGDGRAVQQRHPAGERCAAAAERDPRAPAR